MRLHYLLLELLSSLLLLSFWLSSLLLSSLLSVAMPRARETLSKSSCPHRGRLASAARTCGRPAKPHRAPIASLSSPASASSSLAIASSASSLVVPPLSNTPLLSGNMGVSQFLELIREEVRQQVAVGSAGSFSCHGYI